MASLNKKITTNHRTHEGAPAARITIEQELERTVMSCLLWEDGFYESGVSIADRIKDLCSKLSQDVIIEKALKAKHEMKLRHVPLLLLVYAFKAKKSNLKINLRNITSDLIVRADDITELLAIYWSQNNGKKSLPKALARGIADSFPKFDEYKLAKYRGKTKAIKLSDAIKLVRPKPKNDEQAELWRKLVKDELATPDTWEVLLSAAKTPEERLYVWKKLVSEDKLGGLATLRNLRNMAQDGYDAAIAIRKINPKYMLPINFLKAAEHADKKYEHIIEEKFFEVFSKEKLSGKTVLLIDVSGSMQGENTKRAASLGMIAREMFSDIEIFIFGDTVRPVAARRGFALADSLKCRNESTYLGRAITEMEKIKYDRLIVVTDEQSHDSVPQPKGKGYMINVDSNKNGVGYGKWVNISGWSDSILNYIIKNEQLKADLLIDEE